MDFSALTIKEASTLLERKEISSEELVGASLERIRTYNNDLNAFLDVFDSAIDKARQVDAARIKGEELPPLSGIPFAVKNCILIQGKRATAGSQMLENYVASYNATVIDRLHDAGAIVVGTTNMDAFALGSTTENSHFGPTKNPWNQTKVPGGTSGGSAAAVVAGMVPAALGSDTGGSLRFPAALCGAVGFKPTYGRVSRYGLIAAASSLEQIGPLTRTVEDAATVLAAIAGDDPRDATTVSGADVTIPELIPDDIAGLRIGVPKEYFTEGMDEQVKKAVMDAVEILRKGGAEVQEVSLPHAEYALAAFYIINPCEVSSNLARFDGMRYGFSSSGENLIESYSRSRGQGFGAEAKRRIMIGSYALSAGYYDAYYKKALQVRTLIRQDFDEAFKRVDAIASPTSPAVAWTLGEKFEDPLAMYLVDIYTISANLAAIPAMSMSCGFSQGLPIGFQLMGRPFGESTLFRLGKYYQSVTDWHTRAPEL
jgi:aspartyl-tRNA(Asn)/glutamyl-tRNA(Gln) amidotransferase subunit A